MQIRFELKRWHLIAAGATLFVGVGALRWFTATLGDVLTLYALLILTLVGTGAAGLVLSLMSAFVVRIASTARRDLRIYRYEARRDRLVETAPDDDVRAALKEVARDIAQRY